MLVDDREKPVYRIPFPETLWWTDATGKAHGIKIATEVTRLETGDIYLKEYSGVSRMELKRSMNELCSNLLTKDRNRQGRAFERLVATCRYPYLVLDFSLAESFKVSSTNVPGNRVFDELCRAAARWKLGLLWMGHGQTGASRRLLGDRLVRILWNHAWHDLTQEDL